MVDSLKREVTFLSERKNRDNNNNTEEAATVSVTFPCLLKENVFIFILSI
jgi:hypothetical protein